MSTSIQDRWTAGCGPETQAPAGPGRRLAKYFTLTLSNQAGARILLRSPDADACLYVRSGAAKSGWAVNEHINNDDAGSGAHMVETLAAGTHTIEATTYEPGESGNFTLSAVRATE